MERNEEVNAIDNGDRTGICWDRVGRDKTLEFNFEERRNNNGEISWGQKEKCPLMGRHFYSGVMNLGITES